MKIHLLWESINELYQRALMMNHQQINNDGSTELSTRGNMVWRNLRDKSPKPISLENISRISKKAIERGLYFSKKTSRLNHVRLKDLVELQV